MNPRLLVYAGSTALLVLTSGCGSAPSDSNCCVQWVALVESSVRAGIEIRLDGKLIYENASANQVVNRTELVRSADDAEHVFEFTVVAAEAEPAVFTATVTIQRRPNGDFEFLHSASEQLRVGDRMTVTVPR